MKSAHFQSYTSLYGGERVRKDDLRMEACGTLDELSCHLGWIAAEAPPEDAANLHEAQRRLFAIGAKVAGMSHPDFLPKEEDVEQLRATTCQLEQQSGGFQGFILPGGTPLAARTQICRAVCRRAERRVIACGVEEMVPYLNRLSGYLYALALHFNAMQNVREIRV